MSWKPALFLTSGKDTFNLVGPLDQAIFSHWANTQKHSTCEDMCLRTNKPMSSNNEVATDKIKQP
jgi:hypothetical protein